MNATQIQTDLQYFKGTTIYYKHMVPGKSRILITEGCNYVRRKCHAYWLFDAILSYQEDKLLKDVGFQIWELKLQEKDLTWLLTCKEDKGMPAIIKQEIPYSDFPLQKIVIWLIGGIALLPTEY
jgi:hypothetical protein